MKDVAIVSYCRTGIAKAQRGALNLTHGIPLAAHVMKEAVTRVRIEAGEIEVALASRRPRPIAPNAEQANFSTCSSRNRRTQIRKMAPKWPSRQLEPGQCS
jgi:acetyl-CoA acetyltransferase